MSDNVAWVGPLVALIIAGFSYALGNEFADKTSTTITHHFKAWQLEFIDAEDKAEFETELLERLSIDADRLQLIVAFVGSVPAILLPTGTPGAARVVIACIYLVATVLALVRTDRLYSRLRPLPTIIGLRPVFVISLSVLLLAFAEALWFPQILPEPMTVTTMRASSLS